LAKEKKQNYDNELLTLAYLDSMITHNYMATESPTVTLETKYSPAERAISARDLGADFEVGVLGSPTLIRAQEQLEATQGSSDDVSVIIEDANSGDQWIVASGISEDGFAVIAMGMLANRPANGTKSLGIEAGLLVDLTGENRDVIGYFNNRQGRYDDSIQASSGIRDLISEFAYFQPKNINVYPYQPS
jgi:hypothetical protein